MDSNQALNAAAEHYGQYLNIIGIIGSSQEFEAESVNYGQYLEIMDCF